MCFDVSSHHHLDIISHHHFHSCYQHLFKHQLPTCIYSVLAADEGLRGRNVLSTNSVLRPLLKVSQTSINSSCRGCRSPHAHIGSCVSFRICNTSSYNHSVSGRGSASAWGQVGAVPMHTYTYILDQVWSPAKGIHLCIQI